MASQDLQSKALSLCASYRWNSRNLEHPWYLVWSLALQTLTNDKIILAPQYPLWVSSRYRVGASASREQDTDSGSNDSDGNYQADLSMESDVTMPDGTATLVIPDFTLIHVKANRLPDDHRRYSNMRGFLPYHTCLPVLVEIKRFPSRSKTGQEFIALRTKLIDEAIGNLGRQCSIAFTQRPLLKFTFAIAAAGSIWIWAKVLRENIVPVGRNYSPNSLGWWRVEWSSHVDLCTPDSTLRLQKISHDIMELIKKEDGSADDEDSSTDDIMDEDEDEDEEHIYVDAM